MEEIKRKWNVCLLVGLSSLTASPALYGKSTVHGITGHETPDLSCQILPGDRLRLALLRRLWLADYSSAQGVSYLMYTESPFRTKDAL